uniref:G protein-coupled receptor n=1 Tax=Heterorhabditis bacteriophora TaxID=37862 RepID=A0A1I7XCM1_HETBA
MGKELRLLASGGKSVEVQGCPYSFVNQNILYVSSYLLNPITIASTAILSFTLVNNLIVASFVFFFFRGNLYPCISLLAVSAHLSLYTVIGVASLFLRFPSNLQRFISILGLLVGFLTLVTGNWLLNGMDWSFISDTYGFMKDSHLHLTVTLLLVAVFSSYPTLNDSSIYLSLLPIFDQYKKYVLFILFSTNNVVILDPRFTLVIGGTIVTCVILMPIMWHMWIVAGSGNANFYFAVTLIYNVSQIYLMMDLMFAYFRKEADDICANLVTPKTNFILY